ncbi:very short patch repair endonuclease, partial [Pseudomonas cedrina]
LPKFAANIERDLRKEAQLQALGLRVLLVWECETKQREELTLRLRRELKLSEAVQDGASS